jgi:hypothetical protein
MTPEEILYITSKKNMKNWDLKDFKKTHPALYKTIIESINYANHFNQISDENTPKYGTEEWLIMAQEIYKKA